MGQTIGFLNDQVLHRDRRGGLSCDHAFVRFLLGFRRRFDRLVLYSRIHPEVIEQPRSVRVTGAGAPDGVTVVELPFYPRISNLLTQPWRWWPAVDAALGGEAPAGTSRPSVESLDALWLNCGHPISVRALARVARARRGDGTAPRLVAALRGNYENDASMRVGSGGVMRRAARWAQTGSMHVFARQAARLRVPVLAYGADAERRAQQLGMRTERFETTLLDGEMVANPPDPDPAQACDVLVICRLVNEKGLDRLLDGLGPVRGAGGAPATLAIVGDGALREPLEQQAARLGLSDRVTFRGYVAHGRGLMQMLRSARVFALPSRTEGVPGTVLEAMAMRVPVVATAVGGLPELCAGGRALLVEPHGEDLPARFADALQRMIDDEELRAATVERGFERVADLTLEGQVDRVAALLAA